MIALVLLALQSWFALAFVYAWGGIDLITGVWLFMAAAVVALALWRFPTAMTVLVATAAAGTVWGQGLALRTDPGMDPSDCASATAAAVASVPDAYWTRWILVSAAAWMLMVAGSFVARRAAMPGNVLLVAGSGTLVLGTLLLWFNANNELRKYYDVAECGDPFMFGRAAAISLAVPTALLAIAAVVAGWNADARLRRSRPSR
ncbi:MAG TPA: hypothetical protein VLB86_13625 [Gaiellaceae bacterium]|nr:hypothetical protein [Gaiellaceae bacterium]